MRANLALHPPVAVLPLPSPEMTTLRVTLARAPRVLQRTFVRVKIVPVVRRVARFFSCARKTRRIATRRTRGTARAGPARPRLAKPVV